MMSITFLAFMAALAAGDPLAATTPQPSHEVSPVVVTARPQTAPPADAKVEVGSDYDHIAGQSVSIWPAGARAAGLSGSVTLSCMVDVHGLAEWCRVAYETPPGRGFGDAAMALRPTLKLAPRQGPDGPVDSMMNIALSFSAQQSESNLREVMAAASGLGGKAPETGQSLSGRGVSDVNARDLVVYHNPIDMRRVTLMDSRGWVQAPSFADLAAAYPSQGGGQEGYAVAHCKVERTGTLKGCVVAKELPAGHGFGRAAVALAPQFRVSPDVMAQAPHGAPVEVDVPIRFPAATEARDRTVRSPVWVAGYDPQTLIRDFPPAVAKKVSPGAVVRCEVAADGSLSGCAIELTSPDGLDFDDAAVKFASRLKMSLWSAEAGPVQGGVVHLPVRLDLAER
jgi:TonB family protein